MAPTNDVSGWSKTGSHASENRSMSGANYERDAKPDNPQGRFPANLIHDGSEEVVKLFPETQNSAARFFYCAKASKSERNQGLDETEGRKNYHPTVKPLKLMEYLCKLITPPNGIVLDPYMGSGTTGIACRELGRVFIGIEKKPEYFIIAKNRVM